MEGDIMVYAVEYLAKALKRARKKKKLSQRALSKKVGMPQPQISRIENAAVDLQASSLIELARALDLEVMLVHRKHVPAVASLIRASGVPDSEQEAPRPAYSLEAKDDHG
jgi:transcriptional regulator with XRE-family HTH domain